MIKLLIDSREREIAEHFKTTPSVSVSNIDIGDIQFVYSDGDDNKIILLIERKTISDLSASICDGRYREQKARILGSGLNRNRIMYLIEGNVNSKITLKGGSKVLVSSLINAQLRDGFHVYKTANMKETIEYIENILDKFNKNLTEFWNWDSSSLEDVASNYAATLKTKKKLNMTKDVWFKHQIMSIPQVSDKIADAVISRYASLKTLMFAYENLEASLRPSMIEKIEYSTSTGKTRKIGPVISKRVFEFVFE
jgi:crossover junction endonuclease MUS81